jgi:hypothetical protein
VPFLSANYTRFWYDFVFSSLSAFDFTNFLTLSRRNKFLLQLLVYCYGSTKLVRKMVQPARYFAFCKFVNSLQWEPGRIVYHAGLKIAVFCSLAGIGVKSADKLLWVGLRILYQCVHAQLYMHCTRTTRFTIRRNKNVCITVRTNECC